MIPRTCKTAHVWHLKPISQKRTLIYHKKSKSQEPTDVTLPKNYQNLVQLKNFLVDQQCKAFPITEDPVPRERFQYNGASHVDILMKEIEYAKSKGASKVNKGTHVEEEVYSYRKKLNKILNGGRSQDEELYTLFKGSVDIKKLKLTKFESAVIIRRLREYHERFTKFFISELKYSSRIHREDYSVYTMEPVLKKVTNKIHNTIKAIELSQDSKLPISESYEDYVSFLISTRRSDSADIVLSKFKALTKADPSYYMTKGIYESSLRVSGNADLSTWKIGRFPIKKVSVKTPRSFVQSIGGGMEKFPWENLLVDTKILNLMILNLGHAKNLEGLELLLKNFLGVDLSIDHDKHDDLPLDPSGLTYPNVDTLINILFSYTYNDRLYQGVETIHRIMSIYYFNHIDILRIYESLMTAVGLVSQNTRSDITTELWKRGAEKVETDQEFKLQYDLFELLIKNRETYFPSDERVHLSNSFISSTMKYGSIHTLLECLPQIQAHITSLKGSQNYTAERYSHNVYLSYINTIVTKLAKLRLFYDADKVIKDFSLNEAMGKSLEHKLNIAQKRYMDKKHLLHEDKANDTTGNQHNDYDDEDSVIGLW